MNDVGGEVWGKSIRRQRCMGHKIVQLAFWHACVSVLVIFNAECKMSIYSQPYVPVVSITLLHNSIHLQLQLP